MVTVGMGVLRVKLIIAIYIYKSEIHNVIIFKNFVKLRFMHLAELISHRCPSPALYNLWSVLLPHFGPYVYLV